MDNTLSHQLLSNDFAIELLITMITAEGHTLKFIAHTFQEFENHYCIAPESLIHGELTAHAMNNWVRELGEVEQFIIEQLSEWIQLYYDTHGDATIH